MYRAHARTPHIVRRGRTFCWRRQNVARTAGKRPRAFLYTGKFLARFVYKKDFFILSCLWMWLDSAFQTCSPLSKIQRDARRAHRSPRFRAIFAPIPALGRRPGDRRAPEPQPRAAAARQNLKSRLTGIFRRPDPAFSDELSRRTQPVIVRDTRTRRDNPPTGGRESVRRERTPAADARRRSRRPATEAARHPRRSLRPISAPEQGRSARAGSPLHKLRQDAPKRRHKPPGRAKRPQAEPERRRQGRRAAGAETPPGAHQRPQEPPRSLPRSTRPRRPADDLSASKGNRRAARPQTRGANFL